MLLTKIHIPQPKENVIHRYILFDKLNDILGRKLILVSAPAGYGKTTLICDWLNKSKMPTAWFSIDHRDNDAFEFVNIVINGIQLIHKNIGNQSLALLKSKVTVSIEYIVELLINDILSVKTDFLLVLDDLHLIKSNEIFYILNILITQSPGNFKIAILTRSDPPISLSRLRSNNELIEIRSSDLSFTANDINELFNKNLKLGLNNEDIHIIKTKTEGWIAGLQLAAISLQGKENITEFINGIAGYNRYIMDYLIEEVLTIQNEEIKEFLLHTSIFEQLSSTLCDAVLQKDNSQFILESLEKNNLFVVSLDNNREWFRYHHLFQDLLNQRLKLSNKELLLKLHDRASSWFESNNMPRMAVEHALKAGNMNKGLKLIDEIIDCLLETAQYSLILKYAELFSYNDFVSNLKFGILYAWSLTITGRLAEAEKLLGKVESKILNEDCTDDTNRLLGIMYTTYTLLYDFKGNEEDALKYAEQSINCIPKNDLTWNSWAYYCKAGPHLLRLELDESISFLTKGLEFATKTNNAYLEIVHNKISYLLKLKGRYSEALNYCNKMLKDSLYSPNDEGFKISLFASVLYSTIGVILVEQDKIKEGLQMALKGFEMSQKLVSISFRGYGRLLLAEAYCKAGELKKALDIIDNLETNLKENSKHWLSVLSNALKLKLYSRLELKEDAESFYNQVVKSQNNHPFEYHLYSIASAYYFIMSEKYNEAEEILEKISSGLKKKKVMELFAEVQILKVKIFILTGRKSEANICITDLLILTQKEKLIRLHVNEGKSIAGLIKEITKLKANKASKEVGQISNQYLKELNSAFEAEINKKNVLVENDLSSRELEILRLISMKLSNNDICEKLYISLSTVKTHVSNILLKLEAGNRTEASEIARQRGLI